MPISLIAAVRTALLAAVVAAGFSSGPAEAQTANTPKRTAAQLEQLVAPIALYPDDLLTQVLMASTYPLEVVEAARWSKANPQTTGPALETAMQQQDWDPSVKALTAVPQTLQLMNDKLDWMQDLGDAFLAQESEVLTAVQRLRARADANGQLKSTPQQKVTKVERPPASAPPPAAGAPAGAAPPVAVAQPIYTIEPAVAGEYYPPVYDPAVVYGAWPYPDYAPYSWYPGVGAYAFGAAALTGAAIWGRANWWNNNVGVNVNNFNQFNRTNIANGNWSHNPAHRGGVPYRDQGVAQRFGDQGRAASRDQIRGRQGGASNIGKAGAAGLGAAAGAGVAGKLGQSKVGQGKAGQGKVGQGKAAGSKVGQGKAAGSKAGQGKAASKVGQGKSGAKSKAAAKSGASARAKQAGGSRQGAQRQAAARQGARPGGGAMNRGPSRSARASMPGGGMRGMGGGGFRGGGGGGFRGGGGRGGRGGGRRSDINLKHDIALIGHLDNGLGLYRFSYNGSDKAYVGVMAQEVQVVRPDAVSRGRDGMLRVRYDMLGVKFQTYDQWIGSGRRVPAVRAE